MAKPTDFPESELHIVSPLVCAEVLDDAFRPVQGGMLCFWADILMLQLLGLPLELGGGSVHIALPSMAKRFRKLLLEPYEPRTWYVSSIQDIKKRFQIGDYLLRSR